MKRIIALSAILFILSLISVNLISETYHAPAGMSIHYSGGITSCNGDVCFWSKTLNGQGEFISGYIMCCTSNNCCFEISGDGSSISIGGIFSQDEHDIEGTFWIE